MRYAVGQRVRVAARPHAGHHRTPAYAKGKTGEIVRAARVVHEPGDASLRRGRAAASSRSTWSASRNATSGPTIDSNANDRVYIDLFEHWLEAE